MSFLVWWKPSTWLDDLGAMVTGQIFAGLRTFFYFISTFVYGLVIKLYKLFIALSRGRLLDNTVLEALSSRVGLLLGLIMVFYVVISFIRMLVDPDTLVDSKKGAPGVIKKVLIVIVLLGFSSYAFDTLYSVQTVIINENVIAKLVWPGAETVKTDQFGNVLAAEIFTTFYTVDSRIFEEDHEEIDICKAERNILKERIYENGDFQGGYNCLNTQVEGVTLTYVNSQGKKVKKQYDDGINVMEFDWLLMLVFGIAYIYFLASYAISVGIRMMQLAVLEIISPMAFISYLAPKEGMFMNWLKLYFSTYVDVFIRVAIINLSVFLIAQILTMDQDIEFWKTVNVTDDSKNLVLITMIVALLFFAKRVPELLKQLFPNMGGLGFGGLHIKDALGLSAGVGVAGMGVGAVLGATANSVVGAIDRGRMAHKLGKNPLGVVGAALSGAGSGMVRGVRYGVQNKGNIMKNIPAGFKAQNEADLSYENMIAGGGSAHGKLASGVLSHFGETKGQGYQRMISNLDRMDKYKSDMYAAADEAHAVKSAKDTWEQMHQNVGESVAHYENRKNDAYERYKSLRNSFVDAAVGGSSDYAGGTMDDDDMRYATDVRAVISEADSFSKSHDVVHWDQTANGGNGAYKKIGPITSRTQLADASNYAHETKTYITSQPDYSSSIANDMAAGVNDKRKFGPPGGGN